MQIVVYHFPKFKLEYTPKTGNVKTIFEDGSCSDVQVNKDHEYHAQFFNKPAAWFSLQHELTHHILALAMYQDWCPIIWNSAHEMDMPEHADKLEWLITSLQYFSMGIPFRPNHEHEWKALYEVALFRSPYTLKNIIHNLMNEIPTDLIKITYK